ncbi:hypothetical protein HDU78_003992 [Chytriomyces hyalinus]|nr:hypothetical protein HDU78_003992 [Chytriomyces hyalinus]
MLLRRGYEEVVEMEAFEDADEENQQRSLGATRGAARPGSAAATIAPTTVRPLSPISKTQSRIGTSLLVVLFAIWNIIIFFIGVAVSPSLSLSANHPLNWRSGGTHAATSNDIALDHILLFGDSITAYSARTLGYSGLLRNEYNHKMDTIVRGFLGLNTREALSFVAPVLRSTSPSSPHAKTALMLIMLGSNDATQPTVPAAHIPIPEYKDNLKKIITSVQKLSPGTRVVLVTPPFMSVEMMMHRTKAGLKQYRDECLKAAKEIRADGTPWSAANFTVMDSWDALLGGDGLGDKDYDLVSVRDLFEDGLHLSAKGNSVLGKALIAKIRDVWEDLRAERISNRLPAAKWMQQETQSVNTK